MKSLLTDNGTEYTNRAFQAIVTEKGIDHKFTGVNCPQSNGVSERYNLSLAEGSTAILLESGISHYYWPNAVSTFVRMKNVTPHSAIDFDIPFRKLNDKNFNYSNLFPFGTKVIVFNEKKKSKFDPPGLTGRMLGYASKMKGYTVLLDESRKVANFRHIKFEIGRASCRERVWR